ncbi:hypothetical protein Tco_1219793 [Tanacetum coccineum]
MYLAEIVKFYDATLKRVLKEVKLKIFKSEPGKKSPLLGKLDLDILKAFKREISKRLRHRVQMRSRLFLSQQPQASLPKQPPCRHTLDVPVVKPCGILTKSPGYKELSLGYSEYRSRVRKDPCMRNGLHTAPHSCHSRLHTSTGSQLEPMTLVQARTMLAEAIDDR